MKTEIYVSCHKPFLVPDHPLLCPIQVGAALADCRLDGWIQDDAGENISEKNRSYCELTAQYWAWKHSEADYVGFFHYRRYLYPDEGAKGPYIIRKEPTDALLARLRYEDLEPLIGSCDIVAPKGEDMRIPVRAHYAQAEHHRAEDLALGEEIVRALHPEDAQAMETYLSGSLCYFGNIYIMCGAVFDDYCAWLFPILAEFDRRAHWEGRSAQQMRADGYLAERLFGVYLTARRERLRVKEIPRVHFEPDGKERLKQQLINTLLPPGSMRRARVKAMRL